MRNENQDPVEQWLDQLATDISLHRGMKRHGDSFRARMTDGLSGWAVRRRKTAHIRGAALLVVAAAVLAGGVIFVRTPLQEPPRLAQTAPPTPLPLHRPQPLVGKAPADIPVATVGPLRDPLPDAPATAEALPPQTVPTAPPTVCPPQEDDFQIVCCNHVCDTAEIINEISSTLTYLFC